MPGATDPADLGPRSLLAMLGAFAGLVILVVVGSTIAGARGQGPNMGSPEAGVQQPEAEVLAFLGPLATGERLDGWMLERIAARRAGGLPLVLRGPGALRVEVELRPLDPRSPPAPAASETLAVYVRGRDLPPEALVGVLALARALRSREADGARLPGLWPLSIAR